MTTGTAAAFSELVSTIYDCVLTPGNWPRSLDLICQACGCLKGAITITAFDGSETRLVHTTGFDSDWQQQYRPEFSHDAARFFRSELARPDNDIDSPFVLSRLMPREAREMMPVYRDWAAPQGLCDVMSAIVLVTPHRVASVDFMRHVSNGLIEDGNVEVLRLLAPHLRRAITISDLLDEQHLVAESLRATLDGLAVAVVIVDDEACVLESNTAARLLMERAVVAKTSAGRLAAPTQNGTRRLHAAIARARHGEAGLGAESLGILIAGEGRNAVTAHILPLATGDIRTRLVPNAVATVFITGSGIAPRAVLDGIVATYRLTVAEARLLAEVCDARGVPEAAATLGTTVATARTHMKRIYAKLGVERHAELVAMIQRMAPPVRD